MWRVPAGMNAQNMMLQNSGWYLEFCSLMVPSRGGNVLELKRSSLRGITLRISNQGIYFR